MQKARNPVTFTSLVLLLLCFVFLVGCSRELLFEVPIDSDEGVNKEDAVFIDGEQAGQVVRLLQIDGKPYALVRVNPGDAQIRAGTYRDSEDGRINLRTDSVDPQSAPLASGTKLPRQKGLPPELLVFADDKTILLIVIAVVVLLVVVWAFKFFYRLTFIIFALALSGMLAWVSHPYLIPFVSDLYSRVPIETVSETIESESSLLEEVVEDVTGLSGVSKGVKRILVNKPDPTWTAFSLLLFIYFIIITLLLGKATRGLRTD